MLGPTLQYHASPVCPWAALGLRTFLASFFFSFFFCAFSFSRLNFTGGFTAAGGSTGATAGAGAACQKGQRGWCEQRAADEAQ